MAFVVTAVATAIEVGTFAAIATAVSQVGIAMTVVGVVTKSKELTKIGGALGLAGGIASLASMATSTAAGAASELGANAAGGVASDAGTNLAVGAGEQAAADTFAGAATADAAKNISTEALQSGAANAAGAATGAAGNAATSAAPSIFGEVPTGMAGNAAATNLTAGMATPVAALPSPSLFSDPKAWFKALTPAQQSTVGTAVLSAGGQAVGGLFQGWSAQQKLDLEREIQAENNRRYNTSIQNANAIPTIQYKPAGLVSSVKKGG